jgi:tryptophan 2,3-dioxygenase
VKRAKILKDYQGLIKPVNIQSLKELRVKNDEIDMLIFFKHKCDNRWLKRVLKKAKVDENCIGTDEVRRVLIEAIKLKLKR